LTNATYTPPLHDALPIWWGQTSVENLANAIEEARQRPPERLLTALGIRHVGGTMARRLIRAFGSIPALLDAPVEAIQAVEGVGEDRKSTRLNSSHVKTSY